MDEYEFHPFADAFPMMTDREHAELVADIKANGMYDSIMLYQGKILDGRNRYKACRELGRDTGHCYEDFRDFHDDDDEAALAFVITKNLIRRHLDASQRAMVAAKLSTLKHGQHKSDTSIDVSQAEAAKRMNVSLPSTQRARKVIDNGDPELVAAVERGDVAVSKAAKQIEAATCDNHPEPPTKPKKPTLYCSFCGKSQHEVRKLIAAATVFICDECVELCMDIIREEDKSEPQIDPATLSKSAQEKLAVAMRQAGQKLQAGYDEAVRKAAEQHLEATLPFYNKTYAEYQNLIVAREGVMDKKTFRLIWSCLHTDSRKSLTDEKLNEAFNAFSKLEKRLLNEDDSPTAFPKLPKTKEEWDAAKAKANTERKAKRGHQNVTR